MKQRGKKSWLFQDSNLLEGTNYILFILAILVLCTESGIKAGTL